MESWLDCQIIIAEARGHTFRRERRGPARLESSSHLEKISRYIQHCLPKNTIVYTLDGAYTCYVRYNMALINLPLADMTVKNVYTLALIYCQ